MSVSTDILLIDPQMGKTTKHETDDATADRVVSNNIEESIANTRTEVKGKVRGWEEMTAEEYLRVSGRDAEGITVP